MPVLVKNVEPGPSVFTDPVTKVQVEWQGAGDTNGEDVQQVPDELINNVSFLKAIQRGVFEVVEATDEIKAKLEQQTSSWKNRQEEAEKASVDAIDQQANNDLVTVPCIGPNQRGAGECGEPVPVREKTKDEKPPLCSRHQGLAPQYVVTETDQFVDGKPVSKWQRMGMTDRQQQQ